MQSIQTKYNKITKAIQKLEQQKRSLYSYLAAADELLEQKTKELDRLGEFIDKACELEERIG